MKSGFHAALWGIAAAAILAACGGQLVVDDSTGGAGGGGGAGGSTVTGGGGEGGVGFWPWQLCDDLGLAAHEWSEGPYGTRRGELADTFTLALMDGTTWTFDEMFSGCESYLFIPDTLAVSELDPESVWESDLKELVTASPRNTHYFFVSRKTTGDEATASLIAMQARVEELLASFSVVEADHWRRHLHVVVTRATDMNDYVGDVLLGHGRAGFAIDRRQKIRGVGFLADVDRYSAALNSAGKWPWKSNLAYAANEARYFEAEEQRTARMEAEEAEGGMTIVPLWDGEVLEQFAETDVDLPSAAEMADFDTLEVVVESGCPDPDEIEFGNCGAWDYLATLAVRDEANLNVEIARFITSYHRETRWVVDASAMLALLKDGGSQHFRWDFAPEWNTQPTATRMSLRLSNRSKGYAPSEAFPLWSGGPFDSAYNVSHAPIDVPIPADAVRVELVALVTGHGAGTNQCSEFCNHQHRIAVNGSELLHQFEEAGSDDGCIAQLEHGMVPNQGGTWWFGRGGWCPGQQVDPWVEDVTEHVVPGEVATLTYEGLFDDQAPADGSGDIVLSSHLVVYR